MRGCSGMIYVCKVSSVSRVEGLIAGRNKGQALTARFASGKFPQNYSQQNTQAKNSI